MHMDFDDVLAEATELGDGYKRADVDLGPGDTVWCPGSTKKVIKGRGRYRFLIHASGVRLIKSPAGCRHIPTTANRN